MKKIFVLLSILFVSTTFAQPYGQAVYPYTGAILSSAKIIQSPPAIAGHLMAGYEPTFSTNNYNFVILKTDPNGRFVTSNPIHKRYTISRNPSCQPNNGNWSIVQHCEGVKAIETNQAAYPYAVAGTTKFGCWFATLDKTGILVNMKEYQFPTPQPTSGKALLVQSTSKANTYFIVGKWKKAIYALQVDNMGNILWQNMWAIQPLSSIAFFEPQAIIEGPPSVPGGPTELAIVGHFYDGNYGSGVHAFLLKADATNGSLVSFTGYDATQHNTYLDHGFQDIKVIGNPPNQNYVICGWNNGNPPAIFNSWLIELDLFGNIVWSTFYSPYSGFPPMLGTPALVARVNTSNKYEFHVASFAQNWPSGGLQTCKFNDIGIPFYASSFNPNASETYHFDPSAPNAADAVAIDFEDNLTTKAVTAYGNMDATNPGNFFMVRNCFNEISGCENTTTFPIIYAQPAVKLFYPTLITPNSLTQCNNITLHWIDVPTAPITCSNWGNTVPPNGSNLKLSGAQISEEDQIETNNFSVFPNPSNDKTTVSYSIDHDGAKVKLDIYDHLGRLIKNINDEETKAGNYKNDIDFKVMDLESGMYVITLSVDGHTNNIKILYNK